MDTFYEENQNQVNNIKMLKSKMTLDFNAPAKIIKTCILESPDLKMLKFSSPELERMIIQQNGLVTTTPTPSAILPYFLKQEQEATEEQEQFSRGFVDALNQLHQTNSQQHPTSGQIQAITSQTQHPSNGQHTNDEHETNCLNDNNNNINNNNNNNCINSCQLIKVEPNQEKGNYPSMKELSGETSFAQPIDMKDQERIKLERKRLRNRIAASKCRRRKLERISKLEDKVKALRGENSELSIVVNKLKDQVCSLKQQVMEHVNYGCELIKKQ